MTQKELVLEYVREHGEILPAKISGLVYKGYMFGSETSKRCRELRASGSLKSHGEGKFEVFTLNPLMEVWTKAVENALTPPGYVRRDGHLFKII